MNADESVVLEARLEQANLLKKVQHKCPTHSETIIQTCL